MGLIVVLVSVVGGYMMSGGLLMAFWQPGELAIILGAGAGAMIIANPRSVLTEMWAQMRQAVGKSIYTAEFQQQLLMLLYELLELVQDGGLKALDAHIEVPRTARCFSVTC